MTKILSLDVSASSTGWCFTSDGRLLHTGLIKTKYMTNTGERLAVYSEKLEKLLLYFSPEAIVMEDTFSGKNVRTLKLLSEFAGVTKYICFKTLGIDPYVISNNTVKSYYKVRNKKALFDFLVDILDKKQLSFSKENDIIDAVAQLFCYTHTILGAYSFREEKEYGFIYYKEKL